MLKKGRGGQTLLLLLALQVSAGTFGFLPFSQTASMACHWDLKTEIPAYLERHLPNTIPATPFDSIAHYIKTEKMPAVPNTDILKQQIARRFGCGYLISANIAEISIKKRIIGEGRYAGLKSYYGSCLLQVKIYDEARNGILRDEDIRVEVKDNNTSVNIGRLSKDELLFDSLSVVPFGSPTFDRTIAGNLMEEVSKKLHTLLMSLAPPATPTALTKRLIKIAKIIDIQGEDLFLNTGFDDGTVTGHLYTCFVQGDTLRDPDTREVLGISEKRLGNLRILEVKASHFSRGRIEGPIPRPIQLYDLVRVEQ